MKIRSKLAATIIASASIIGMTAAPALAAEGSFSSSITQGQPSFTSRTWTDKNLTADSTIVRLENCKVNRGGAAVGSTPLMSVEIGLVRNGSIINSKKQACGSYNFGRQASANYYFVIVAINDVPANGTRIFLNSNPVTVSY